MIAAAAAGGLALASWGMAAPASADEIWVQAFGRASADAPCDPPADETPWEDTFSGEREWTPSWAQWANGGAGGWVCVRSITWAGGEEASGPTGEPIGCQPIGAGNYFSFGTEPWVPAGSPRYSDAACADPAGSTNSYVLVYAPDGEAQAEARCVLYGNGWQIGDTLDGGPSYPVWGCLNV